MDAHTGRTVTKAAPYSEQAATILREHILAGRFEPGQRLNEVGLSNELGISRSPLREGMRKLADEGLVVLAPNRGAFVASYEPHEVRELMEYRQALDVSAARLAARRADRTQTDGLQVALEAATVAHRQPGEGTTPPWGSDFHILILRASGNRKIIERGTSVHTQLHLVRFRSGATANRTQEAHDEHQEILDRVRQHDEDGAAQAMWEHLERAMRHMGEMLQPETGTNQG